MSYQWQFKIAETSKLEVKWIEGKQYIITSQTSANRTQSLLYNPALNSKHACLG